MKATSIVQNQNERVIVTEWCFAPGAETGAHVHGHDYVVVPLTAGPWVEATGTRSVRLEAGASYARPAGVAHNVINDNDYEFRFVEMSSFRSLTGSDRVSAPAGILHRDAQHAVEQ